MTVVMEHHMGIFNDSSRGGRLREVNTLVQYFVSRLNCRSIAVRTCSRSFMLKRILTPDVIYVLTY